jgi:hypothetical protein
MSYTIDASLLTIDGFLLKTGPNHYVLDNTIIHDRNRSTLAHKIGRMAGRTKKFLTKKQTYASTLIAYWAVETVFYVLMLIALQSAVAYVMIVPLWVYGTACLFCAINN